jgi:hypothetical protein
VDLVDPPAETDVLLEPVFLVLRENVENARVDLDLVQGALLARSVLLDDALLQTGDHCLDVPGIGLLEPARRVLHQPAQELDRLEEQVQERGRHPDLSQAELVEHALQLVGERTEIRESEHARKALQGVGRTEDLIDEVGGDGAFLSTRVEAK